MVKVDACKTKENLTIPQTEESGVALDHHRVSLNYILYQLLIDIDYF